MEIAGSTQLEAGQTYQFPFELQLIEGVPPTFTAAHSHLHWYVEGIADRKLRSDFVVEAEIVVCTGNPATAPGVVAAGELPAAVQEQAGAAQPVATAAQAPSASPGSAAAPGAVPAGWHSDPWLRARLRYWDGNEWTGHTAD